MKELSVVFLILLIVYVTPACILFNYLDKLKREEEIKFLVTEQETNENKDNKGEQQNVSISNISS